MIYNSRAGVSSSKRSSVCLFLCFFTYTISMANRVTGFKPTRSNSPQAIPPESPLHTQYLRQITEKIPLVPRKTTTPSVKKNPYKHNTGTPPFKKFKDPSLEISQLFLHRWILLPREELAYSFASPHTHPYSLDIQPSSSQTPYHPFGELTPREATYKDQSATMPYNNTAIPPPEEITGAASLPC